MPYKASRASLAFTVTKVGIPYIRVDPTTVKWGQEVYHEAVLADELGFPIPGEIIQFQWFYGGTWRTVCEARTDIEGYARCRWTVPYSETVRVDVFTTTVKFPCNTFKVRAYAPAYNASSAEVTVRVYSETTIQVSTNKKSYAPGEEVVVSGKLLEITPTGTSPLAGMTVTIEWWDGARTTVTTGSDGSFTASRKAPAKTGTYTIKVEFAGYGFPYTRSTSGSSIGGGSLPWLALAVASAGLVGLAYARRKRLI